MAVACLDTGVAVVVCDGVSSSPRPDEAAQAATEEGVAVLGTRIDAGDDPGEATRAAAQSAARRVAALAESEFHAPACTYVSAYVGPRTITVGWIGDSRAYWLPDIKPSAAEPSALPTGVAPSAGAQASGPAAADVGGGPVAGEPGSPAGGESRAGAQGGGEPAVGGAGDMPEAGAPESGGAASMRGPGVQGPGEQGTAGPGAAGSAAAVPEAAGPEGAGTEAGGTAAGGTAAGGTEAGGTEAGGAGGPRGRGGGVVVSRASVLTEDDSWAGRMVAWGVLTEAEAQADAKAHVLVGWLGADAGDVEPHVRTFAPDGPGAVVVCSDGLWNYLPEAETLRSAAPGARTDPRGTAAALVRRALDAGGHDNVTVVVVPFPPPAQQNRERQR